MTGSDMRVTGAAGRCSKADGRDSLTVFFRFQGRRPIVLMDRV